MTFHGASKQDRNAVVVTYFDLRAAMSAKNTLQGTFVNGLALEIFFGVQKAPDTHDPVSLSQVGRGRACYESMIALVLRT